MALCVIAGRWQYGRFEERRDAVNALAAAAALPVVPLEEVVPDGSPLLPSDAEWRLVTVTGRFDESSLRILRNRPVDGIPAVHALLWLETDAGPSLLVQAGWFEVQNQGASPPLVVPAEQVTLTVMLRVDERDDARRDGGATRVTAAQMPEPPSDALPGHAVVVTACADQPGCAVDLGAGVPVPDLSLGPHLGYSLQWFVFAALMPFGALLLTRRTPAPTPRAKKRGRRDSDEAVEDALTAWDEERSAL